MLKIHLLGNLRLFESERAQKFSGLPKTLPLYAYLLLNRAVPVPREQLAFTLWPDDKEEDAKAKLRRHLHDLRRALPPAPDAIPWVVADSSTVQWNADAACWLDVAEFEQASTQTGRLAEAAALYSGDLLATMEADWLATERARLRHLFLADLRQLIEQRQSRGDLQQAIAYAQQALAHDPLQEDIVRELMTLRHESGDRSGAVQEYQRFERRLHDEMNVPPMKETRDLYAYLLKDAPAVQVQAQPLSAATPSEHRKPAHIPVLLTSFVGRQEELSAICDLLDPAKSATRLLTLTGAVGAGKTRLSREVAARFEAQADHGSGFPDGVAYVALDSLTDSTLVIPTLARALNLATSENFTPADSLKNYLRDRAMLIVLDNFEQVLSAAPEVAGVLAASPAVKLLITSRALLQIYGEYEFPLQPLPLPAHVSASNPTRMEKLEELLANPAIQLFIERARAANPKFALTVNNAAAIAEICIRLDGLPLALELAAARSKLLSPQAMLAKLDARLALLASGPRDFAARHQTLRAAIDWSYNLLSAEERQLFARLSVFDGGCTEDAIAAITENNSHITDSTIATLLTTLQSLVDKNLVQVSLTEDADQSARFTLLHTLREYAQEKLQVYRQEDATQERHAHYFLALAQTCNRSLKGSDQVRALNTLEADHANFRAALAWFGQHDVDGGLNLAVALSAFWQVRAYFAEGRRWLERLLATAAATHSPARADAMLAVGELAMLVMDHPAAEVHTTAALEHYRAQNNLHGSALALQNLATLAFNQSDYTRATALYNESLGLFEFLNDADHAAAVLNRLGMAAKDRGNFAQAVIYHERGRALHEQAGDLSGVALSLLYLAFVAYWQADFAHAAVLSEQSMQAYRALGNRSNLGYAIETLAMSVHQLGDPARAVLLLRECEAMFEESGDEGGSAIVLTDLGMIARAQLQWEPAREFLVKSLRLCHKAHNLRRLAFALEGLAGLAAAGPPAQQNAVHAAAVRAAQLLGAADQLRQTISSPLPASDLPSVTQDVKAATAQLGEATFTIAFAQGQALSVDEAVALGWAG